MCESSLIKTATNLTDNLRFVRVAIEAILQPFQSINQHGICRVPIYDTSRSANNSQW